MRLNRNILLLIIVTAIFLMLLLFINQERQREGIAPAPVIMNDRPSKDSAVSNYTVLVSKDICEGCHMSGKPFIPQAITVGQHTNGGTYCLKCHRISHETHPIDRNITCEKCHGSFPSIPVFINGSITCNNCHDYPDPLLPSRGNIITIHRPRGITCNNCHTDQCIRCHPDGGGGPGWEKRLVHFRTTIKTP